MPPSAPCLPGLRPDRAGDQGRLLAGQRGCQPGQGLRGAGLCRRPGTCLRWVIVPRNTPCLLPEIALQSRGKVPVQATLHNS